MGGWSSKIEVESDLSSNEAACGRSSSRLTNTLAVGDGVGSLSQDSLKELTNCFLEMNQQMVQVILESKMDILNNDELFDLVKDYFDNGLQILRLCNALEKCLNRARDSQLTIQVAIQQFEQQQSRRWFNCRRKSYARTLQQELKNFKTAGDPFNEEFSLMFQSVYEKQKSMLEKLEAKKGNKWNRMKIWRTLSNVIFVAISASVLICYVVAATMASPPALVVLVAGATGLLGPIRNWIDSLWMKYENELKGQGEIIRPLTNETQVAIWQLDDIQKLVEKLKSRIESLLNNADFDLRNEAAMTVAIGEIKKKLGEFTQTIENLIEQTDNCSCNIMRARKEILDTIIKHRNICVK